MSCVHQLITSAESPPCASKMKMDAVEDAGNFPCQRSGVFCHVTSLSCPRDFPESCTCVDVGRQVLSRIVMDEVEGDGFEFVIAKPKKAGKKNNKKTHRTKGVSSLLQTLFFCFCLNLTGQKQLKWFGKYVEEKYLENKMPQKTSFSCYFFVHAELLLLLLVLFLN